MQTEQLYFALAVLSATLVVLLLLRIGRSAGRAFDDLRRESDRDKLEHARILREKYAQEERLRRSTRKIDGKPRTMNWGQSRQRAMRDPHLEGAVSEAFRSNSRRKSQAAPWGWPSKTEYTLIKRSPGKRSVRSGISGFFASLFQTKEEVSSDSYKLRCEQSLRRMVEDRYGRADSEMTEIGWEKPILPWELRREREVEHIMARKPDQSPNSTTPRVHRLRVVDTQAESPKDGLDTASGH